MAGKLLFGLIGYPIAHSRSPEWFGQWFRDKGIQASYQLFPAPDAEELKRVLEENPDLRGFNVTIPHKRTIFPFLDELDPVARLVGAVNCVRVDQGRRKGFNTDAPAFARTLEGIGPVDRALILGTGGASRAVSYALDQLGIAWQKVSRHPKSSQEWGYHQLSPQQIREFRLIINTTPLGAPPLDRESPPIPYEAIGPGFFLYDLVYQPEATVFLEEGRKRGAWVKNGLEMLHLQAEYSWNIWNTGQPIV